VGSTRTRRAALFAVVAVVVGASLVAILARSRGDDGETVRDTPSGISMLRLGGWHARAFGECGHVGPGLIVVNTGEAPDGCDRARTTLTDDVVLIQAALIYPPPGIRDRTFPKRLPSSVNDLSPSDDPWCPPCDSREVVVRSRGGLYAVAAFVGPASSSEDKRMADGILRSVRFTQRP
jgi:hypothetical protein